MDEDVKRSMAEILKAESEAILSIPVTDAYPAAVEAIVERVHRRGGKLVTAGMGKAGQIAMNIATTFSSTGTPAVNLHPSEAQPGDLVFYPGDTHVGIVGGWDEGGNIQIIHCTSSYNNVVITGKAGFATIGRPQYYSS